MYFLSFPMQSFRWRFDHVVAASTNYNDVTTQILVMRGWVLDLNTLPILSGEKAWLSYCKQ